MITFARMVLRKLLQRLQKFAHRSEFIERVGRGKCFRDPVDDFWMAERFTAAILDAFSAVL